MPLRTLRSFNLSMRRFGKRNGMLMVMLEHYDIKSPKFLTSGKLAVGVKYTAEGMEILNNREHIGYVLFHTRKLDGQHLFAIKGSSQFATADNVPEEYYINQSTADVYVLVDLDTTAELSATVLNSQLKPRQDKATRYDAQFAMTEELKNG